MPLMIADIEDADTDADQFVELCKRELKLYPRSPVVVTKETAKDIDMSEIMRMSPEQIDEALRLMGEAA